MVVVPPVRAESVRALGDHGGVRHGGHRDAWGPHVAHIQVNCSLGSVGGLLDWELTTRMSDHLN